MLFSYILIGQHFEGIYDNSILKNRLSNYKDLFLEVNENDNFAFISYDSSYTQLGIPIRELQIQYSQNKLLFSSPKIRIANCKKGSLSLHYKDTFLFLTYNADSVLGKPLNRNIIFLSSNNWVHKNTNFFWISSPQNPTIKSYFINDKLHLFNPTISGINTNDSIHHATVFENNNWISATNKLFIGNRVNCTIDAFCHHSRPNLQFYIQPKDYASIASFKIGNLNFTISKKVIVFRNLNSIGDTLPITSNVPLCHIANIDSILIFSDSSNTVSSNIEYVEIQNQTNAINRKTKENIFQGLTDIRGIHCAKDSAGIARIGISTLKYNQNVVFDYFPSESETILNYKTMGLHKYTNKKVFFASNSKSLYMIAVADSFIDIDTRTARLSLISELKNFTNIVPSILGFHDRNGNGKLDNNDTTLPNIKSSLFSKRNGNLIHNQIGHDSYSMNNYLPRGEYSIVCSSFDIFGKNYIQNNNQLAILNNPNQSILVPFKSISYSDLGIYFVCNEKLQLGDSNIRGYILIQNHSTENSTTSTKVSFRYLNTLENFRFLSGNWVYEGENNSEITYTMIVPPLLPKQNIIHPIKFDIRSSLNHLGLRPTFYCQHDFNDSSFGNNSNEVQSLITAENTKNYKTGFPNGYTNKEIREVEYTIYFENTLNSEAKSVTITDQLSHLYDLHSIRLMGSNPACKVFGKEGKLVFEFSNANLAVGNSEDPAKKKGFVTFIVQLKEPLRFNDSITNFASIEFNNNNNPIRTNKTVLIKTDRNLIIKDPTPFSSSPVVYPNPFHSKIYISRTSSNLSEVQIYNLNGKLLFQGEVKKNTVELDLKYLSKGIYFIKIDQNKGIPIYKIE